MTVDPQELRRQVRDRHWDASYEPDVLSAAERVLRVGAIPPLYYKGIGMTGVVFCDKRGIGFKAARAPETGIARHFLQQEAAWLRVASTIPEIKAHVAAFRHFHANESVIERECIKGAQRSSYRPDTRWTLYRSIADAVRPYGFGAPEYKDDSFVWQPGRGWVLVDASMPVLRGKKLVARAVQTLKGQRFFGERPRDVAWELGMEAGKTVDPGRAKRLADRLMALADAEERPDGSGRALSSEAGFVRLDALLIIGGVATGFALAPVVDARIDFRPLGQSVPPSVIAAAGLAITGIWASSAGYRQPGRLAAGGAAGLAAGALASHLRSKRARGS